jgi:NTP pyrophosphatase (non-canonical NTP hydrolase)
MEEQLELNLGDPRDINIADMVDEFANTAEQPKNIPLSAMLIKEEMNEWLEDLNDSASKDTHELKELADLVYVIFGYARVKGFDLTEAVSRVHKNNMGRMFQSDGKIHRRDDGKILKNKNYPKVNLEDLV